MTTYQASRDFTFAGRKYARGETFDQKRPAIQIAGMLRARLIKKVAVITQSDPRPVVEVFADEPVLPKRKRRK